MFRERESGGDDAHADVPAADLVRPVQLAASGHDAVRERRQRRSDPAAEWDETVDKARGPLGAIDGREVPA